MYLEGSDQHRGWFHSSLLESVGTRSEPPYREVLTHGYVVDGYGRKMSKSLGNVIAPQKIIDKFGAEIIRLWVSATDYRDDIRISDEILLRLTEAYRRIRNTCRYLLGNLSDFDPEKDRVPYAEMDELDRWALLRLSRVTDRIVEAYDTFQYHNVFHTLHNFCVVDLSNFYLDILKDRMYASAADSSLRRSGQTAFMALADGIVRLMAPILAFTAEEVWENLPGTRVESVFLTEFPRPDAEWSDKDLENRYEKLVALREVVTKAIEEDRRLKRIGNSLEAALVLHVTDRALAKLLQSFGKCLPDLFIVSSATIESHEELPENAFSGDSLPGFAVTVRKAEGGKCERCWKFAPEVGADVKGPAICTRCQSVIEG